MDHQGYSDESPDLLAVVLPHMVEVNYIVAKVTRANGQSRMVARGYVSDWAWSNQSILWSNPIRAFYITTNHVDVGVLGVAASEVGRRPYEYSWEHRDDVIGGGRVKVSHSSKVVMVYEMDGATLESDTGRSRQADVLIDLVNREGCHAQCVHGYTPDPGHERPYTVYYVGVDRQLCVNCSQHVEGARLGPPPLHMYNPHGV